MIGIRQFLDRVAEQGGKVLPDVHEPLVLPPIARDDGSIPSALTTGCGHATLVEIPYQHPEGFPASLRVCARCDGALSWPRFA